MQSTIQVVLEKALKKYTSEDFYPELISAKEKYFQITGAVREEDDDYENRMALFDEWYLFHNQKDGKTKIQEFIETEDLEENVKESLLNVNFSVFEFKGKTLFGKYKVKDLLHSVNLSFTKDQVLPSLIKDDIFIGRTIIFEDQVVLLNGVCPLPREIKSVITKECKKIRKKASIEAEHEFLLCVEYLKTKSLRYNHLDPKKVFVFE